MNQAPLAKYHEETPWWTNCCPVKGEIPTPRLKTPYVEVALDRSLFPMVPATSTPQINVTQRFRDYMKNHPKHFGYWREEKFYFLPRSEEQFIPGMPPVGKDLRADNGLEQIPADGKMQWVVNKRKDDAPPLPSAPPPAAGSSATGSAAGAAGSPAGTEPQVSI